MSLPHEINIPSGLETDLAQTAPAAHPDIFDLYKDWEANRGKAFSRRDSQEKGGWGQTTQIAKEKSGVLRTVRDGKKVLTTAASLYRHLLDRLIVAHPAGSKPRRKPTSQELEGLRKGNEQRRLEGEARRAEKVRRAQEAAAASA